VTERAATFLARAKRVGALARDNYAAIGRELAGLAKGKKWLFLNLVDG